MIIKIDQAALNTNTRGKQALDLMRPLISREKKPISFIMSVSPSACIKAALTGRISMKFDITGLL